MACTYDPTPEETARANKEELEKLNKLTRMLCEACRNIEMLSQTSSKYKWDKNYYFQEDRSLSKELRDWWKQHQVEDKKRQEEEKAKRKEITNNITDSLKHLDRESLSDLISQLSIMAGSKKD